MNLVLYTERLLLRPMGAADADLVGELFSDEAVMRYLDGVRPPDEIETLVTEGVRRGGGGCIGIWCVTRREDGERLGTAILLPLPIDTDDTDWSQVIEDRLPDGEVEIGYLLRRAAWGRGYATEASGRLLRFAFEDTPLDEVVAVTDMGNTASQRVLRKIGMQDEGVRRAYAQECRAFRLTRSAWLEDRRPAAKAENT
jgi:[ribosomal protein S5]-alanine N-acetyltransferase